MQEIFNIVIGTAGHIDHGKSSLVEILTGVNPDRLKEEKERGLTIDLGFAPLSLPNGKKVGIIDVPGHEKFIKNMVAGASGIDFVILVIACDDSVMPQTREHLEIMQILGIKSGLIALTKIDLVDDDLALLAKEEIQEFLQGTFLENSPILPISSVTQKGFKEFKSVLFKNLQEVTPKTNHGIFRMPIQRVFSKHGHGTVITGIPVSGEVREGDTLEVLPSKAKGRVKKIQAYGTSVKKGGAGHSTALNIKDIDYKKIHRGDVIASPGFFEAVHFIEAKFQYLHTIKTPLLHMTPIRFHTGTLEEMGKVAIIGQEKLMPGETGYIQIRLENPVAVATGDRFVVRLSSPMITIGGGVIIGIGEKKLKRFKDKVVEDLKSKEKATFKSDAQLELIVKTAGAKMIKEEELLKALKVDREKLQKLLMLLLERECIECIGKQKRYIHIDIREDLQEKLLKIVNAFFQKFPYKTYIKKLEIKNKLHIENTLIDFILEKLRNNLASQGDTLYIIGREIHFSKAQKKILENIEELFLKDMFLPPKYEDILEYFDEKEKNLLPLFEHLLESKKLLEVAPKIIFHHDAIEKAKELVKAMIEATGELVASNLRDKLGTSRKFIIPLLEYFDSIGLTIRKGNIRVLKKHREF